MTVERLPDRLPYVGDFENTAEQSALEAARAAEHDRRFPNRWRPGASGNPRGRPKGHRAFLRELIGEAGEQGYLAVREIAEGRTRYKVLAREPGPNEDVSSAALIPLVERVPSIRERLDAWQFLVEQLNGKSVAQVDLTSRTEHLHRFDVGRLSDDKLELFESMLAEAEVVEGELLDDVPGLLPENTQEGASLPAGEVIDARPVARLAPALEPAVRPVDASDATAGEFP